MKFNLYSTLGVKPKATIEEIKKAYRKIAMDNHPDKHPNDRKTMKKMLEANEAYEILSNPGKKKKYDDDLMAHLKREIEREKAKMNKTDYHQSTNSTFKKESKEETLEERIKEAGKSVLASVLRFVLKR
jgi:DnaJ-class molecular chaperone